LSVVLGIMVLVHEGVTSCRKAFGVRVEILFHRFGPRLWGRKSGILTIVSADCLSAATSKMAGDQSARGTARATPTNFCRSRGGSGAIAVRGSAMNIILSIVLIAGIYMHGSKEPAYLDQPMVLAGSFADSTAQKSRAAAGDHVGKINGAKHHMGPCATRIDVDLAGHHSRLLWTVAKGGFCNGSGRQVDEDIFGYPAIASLIGSGHARNAC